MTPDKSLPGAPAKDVEDGPRHSHRNCPTEETIGTGMEEAEGYNDPESSPDVTTFVEECPGSDCDATEMGRITEPSGKTLDVHGTLKDTEAMKPLTVPSNGKFSPSVPRCDAMACNKTENIPRCL